METQQINGGLAKKSIKSRTWKTLTAAAILALWSVKVEGAQCRQEVWLISTRCAPVSGDLSSGQKSIRYWRLSADRQWQRQDEGSFHAGDDPAVPTTIVVHGNRIDADEAVEFVRPIYCRLLNAAEEHPFRLVIWSWPSQRMCRRNRPDVQLKFCYCNAQAVYLAACLERLRPDVPLCLIGYSMGGQIVPGSLQLLAGGEVAGRSLAGRHSSAPLPKRAAAVQVLVVAAATDDDSLASDGIYNWALSQVDTMLIVRNCCDRVLRWYPKTYRGRGPEALGYVGPTGSGNYEKIELLDLTCEVGRGHHWDEYLTSCSLWEAIDRYSFMTTNNAAAK
jgi:hypothetical protein